MPTTPTNARETAASRDTMTDLLGFFYPIHYRIGMELERRMCQGRLSRQQAAIIWLIESEVGPHGWIRRKLIEQTLSDWFETRNSHVSQLLHELSSPPLSLIEQKTNPESGREKVVALTEHGCRYFNTMIEAGLAYFSVLLPHLSEHELRAGIKFLGRAFGPPSLTSRDI
ncbi:MarR family winged helix-turn-helix transcriptional regulator [Aromatoleum aromaticum]|uniref:MarR family winged helix-turn-helix transcriptional regulator n=1 Tax=Aromatoleum aromaticum TaxID=551760 RepID=UPI0014593492|nr:MarR family winged helix-turn-helix transcriptional regulator [Aromatoleum aromaticum]NMG55510.1 winged helix DNA-binding protein [Aromatoleum aromaticum]